MIAAAREVRVSFGDTRALDGVSFEIRAGERVAVVGESGCGKTTLARVLLGMQAYEGHVERQGQRAEGIRQGQAAEVGVVWQDPYASLDPRWKVKDLVAEPVRLARREPNVRALLQQVGLSEEFGERYPHQLSGGQRQRVAIARALALQPPLLICDEPTSALDLSVQAQVLNLLKDLQADTHCAILYISHDLATVQYVAERVLVMYQGRVVEEGATRDVFRAPRHPYTALLLASTLTRDHLGELPAAESTRPLIGCGCAFAARCPWVREKCLTEVPQLGPNDRGAFACFFPLRDSKS